MVVALAGTARADVDYFHAASQPGKVQVREGNDRTPHQRMLIGGLAGGGGLALAIGAYFNWQSHEDADAVSSHRLSGASWTAANQATYDRAHSEGVEAIVGYSVAGAFAVALVVALIETDPGDRLVEIDPSAPQATITPTSGGAIVGATGGF
jgi:hypothetical protein